VARSAALRGDAEVVELVEAKLEARLAAARGPELVPFLEAAGNAGCAACVPAIARAATHPSAEVRRVAAAARRFDGTEGAVSSMCGALRGDEAEPVREHAAWALGHLMTHLHLRRACLVNAAQGDESESVRAAARNALGTLGIPQPVEASDPSRSL
ncbi:MAG: HEAT repeat domain-containing protein, partial [Myxococcales bacterium]|nr:HEAT repeat domain-containing protein [Myxococcales bacterium]